jgi:hypothetical protein
MSQFRFRSVAGSDIAPEQWLPMWAAFYPETDFRGYDELLKKHKSFSSTDFEEIGKWKDAATGGRWRPNVASVAYPIWMAAASEPPKCPEKSEVTKFLADWSERKYLDEYTNGSREKRFGLSRATTLLHFLSGGTYPIFDRRVRMAMTRLLGTTVPNKVRWYLDSYCPLFLEVATKCGTTDLRAVDKALFSYGGRIIPSSN